MGRKKQRPLCIVCNTPVKKLTNTYCSNKCRCSKNGGLPMPTYKGMEIVPKRLCKVCGKKCKVSTAFYCSKPCFYSVPKKPETRAKVSKSLTIAYAEGRKVVSQEHRIIISKSTKKYFTELERKNARKHYQNLREAKKRSQTPDDADLDWIKDFYVNCPQGYHVDHIIPLSKGGLHHQSNLQYLSAVDNMCKHNFLPCEWTQYRINKFRRHANG